MDDSAAIANIIAVLEPVVQQRFPTVVIDQLNQPTTQGVRTEPTIYVQKITDHRYGFPRTDHQWQALPGQPEDNIPTTTVQLVESRFQFSALLKMSGQEDYPITASDLLRYAAMALSVDAIIRALRVRGLNIMRIRDVVNPYFTDDSDEFAANPTFDVIIQHYDEFKIDVPKIIIAIPEVHAV